MVPMTRPWKSRNPREDLVFTICEGVGRELSKRSNNERPQVV